MSVQPIGSYLNAVIFDMDGTLVSTLPVIHHCESSISKQYLGKTLTLEEVISNFGPPAHSIIKNMTSSLSETLQKQAVSDYYSCYRENIPKRALVFPGIPQLLRRIHNSGKHLGLFTGVESVMMEYTLRPFSLMELFETRITADDIRNAKPDPEGVAKAVGRLGVNPKEAIYIGDSPNDMTAGREAGVLTGAALWSPENKGDPTKEQHDYEFRSVQQLSEFLFPIAKKGQEPYFGKGRTD